MRVITGSARGRRLKELEGLETRPTTDRVKEGLFSALQFDIEGRRVLDLFAGTGQLGIEALSRGAARCVFVDQRTDAVNCIRENLRLTGLADRAQVVSGESMAYLSALREKFDIIFLDPPYAAGLLEPALAHIARHDLLNRGPDTDLGRFAGGDIVLLVIHQNTRGLIVAFLAGNDAVGVDGLIIARGNHPGEAHHNYAQNQDEDNGMGKLELLLFFCLCHIYPSYICCAGSC